MLRTSSQCFRGLQASQRHLEPQVRNVCWLGIGGLYMLSCYQKRKQSVLHTHMHTHTHTGPSKHTYVGTQRSSSVAF